MATLINKIALRTDTIQNWNALSSQVLLNGEVAIVLTDEKLPLFKIGDGIHKFYELPYSTKKISSDSINATDIIANSICQGIGSTAVPQGIAAGLNVHSNAVFSQAFGNNTTSKDIYSFTWNGKPDQDATNPYQSHDIGSFNINPKDGPKGIYIGEQTLPEVISSCIPEVDLSEYYKKSETSSTIEISDAIQSAAATTKDYVDSKFDTIPTDYAKISVDNEAVQDFKMLHISYDEHAQLVNDENIDPHTIYVLSADGYDDQFGNRIINLGSPISADDAATKNYVDSEIAKIPQPDLSEFMKLSSESTQDISSNLSIDGCLSVRNLVVQDSSVGAAKWGSVEGNVEDQTDLVGKLNEKASKSNVDAIEEKIPAAADASNQLADKAFVNSLINNYAAFYLTKNANGDAFGTYAELTSATKFWNAGVEKTPTKNDYLVVLQDDTKTTALGVNPTTRYIYQGEWPTGQFEFQYIVNNTALTQAQVDAINSGITKSIVDSRVIPSSTKSGYAANAVNADTATTANTALSATYAPDYTPLSTFNETLGDLSSIIHEI